MVEMNVKIKDTNDIELEIKDIDGKKKKRSN
jgi:hypothetical protein